MSMAQRARTLSRVKIVDAGLSMMDRDGAEAITMRRLALDLGVTPMALYNHFGNKQELLRAIADDVIDGAEFNGGQADWQDQLRHCFRTLRDLCLRHPGLPGMLEIEGAAPASVFRPMQIALAALRAAGLDESDSMRAYFALVGYTLSQAAYQARGPYPGLHASLAEEWDYDASFEYGLALIITGIAATAC
jgi:TetR/AcrR family tetracycline transcriptional repressor